MAYRPRTQQSAKLAAMRQAKDAKRMTGPAPNYPPELPRLRRVVIVIDYDHGTVIETMRLYRTSRIDSYRAEIDGRTWKPRIGWSGVCEGLRKSFIRLQSFRRL